MKVVLRAAPGCGRGVFARAAALSDMLDTLARAPLRRRVLTHARKGRSSPRRALPDLAGFAPASKPMYSCRASGMNRILEAHHSTNQLMLQQKMLSERQTQASEKVAGRATHIALESNSTQNE